MAATRLFASRALGLPHAFAGRAGHTRASDRIVHCNTSRDPTRSQQVTIFLQLLLLLILLLIMQLLQMLQLPLKQVLHHLLI